MKRFLVLLGLCLALFAANTARAADAPFDSAAVVAKARELNEAVKLSDAATLWASFDDRMQAAMGGDVSKFETILKQITGQVGVMQEVIREDVSMVGANWVYRGVCRYSMVPKPLITQYAFTTFGKVAGFRVIPDVKEYDSKFLDYQTKTALHLPFNGQWLVAWGGRTLEQNYHAALRDQRFACDLIAVKDSVDHTGTGRVLSDFYAFGMAILAPAAGTVVEATDGANDNTIGKTDPKAPAGNHVVIDFGNSEFGLLAHMKRGTVRVKVGDKVAVGDTLGLCGNSGNTSQPHLHFHLQNGPKLFEADGLPALFVDYLSGGKPVDKGEPVHREIIERKP